MVKNIRKKNSKKRLNKKNMKRGGSLFQPQYQPMQQYQAIQNDNTPILSQFPISDQNIQNFQRFIEAPMDCVINALQIIGLLDTLSSNLIRITSVGKKTGLFKPEIEAIFTLYTGYNYEFKSGDFVEWSNTIRQKLMPGHVAFCGKSNHVFLVGRTLDGTIIYIDPQINQLCNLENPNCANFVRMDSTEWFILHNSEQKLTIDELRLLGFII